MSIGNMPMRVVRVVREEENISCCKKLILDDGGDDDGDWIYHGEPEFEVVVSDEKDFVYNL